MKKIVKIALLLGAGLMAWCCQAADDIAYIALGESGYWQIWTADIQTGKSQQVTFSAYDKSNLSWYPNGQSLLVNGHQGKLVRINIEQGKEIAVPLPFEGVHDATIGPDGQQLAFSLNTSEKSDNNNLWLFDLKTKKRQKLTNMRHLQHEPHWSPDGQYLYFLSGDGGASHDIWRYTLATGSKSKITFNALYNFDVAIASDGRLAFSSNRSGNYELWLRDLDGKLQQVTNHPDLDGSPAWSPDATRLVFQSNRGGNYNLWMLALAEGKAQQLTHHTQGARKPIWRPALPKTNSKDASQ